MHIARRALGVTACTLMVTLPATIATAANDAPGQRQWAVWVSEDRTWKQLPDTVSKSTVKDASIIGLRYSVHRENQPRTPRIMPTFDDVCGAVEKQENQAQIAIVVDFGRQSDAPAGESPSNVTYTCASAPTDRPLHEVLTSSISAKVDNDKICNIDLYPSTGCGEALPGVPAEAALADAPLQPAELPAPPQAVSAADAAAMNRATAAPRGNPETTENTGGSNIKGILIGAGIFAALAAAGVAVWRLKFA